MKILFIFADMLRAVDLYHFNKRVNKKTLIDDWIDRIGGTVYSNCYTPTPDTPRSLSCLYTGMYPNKNGCDTRYKWPKYFMKGFNIFEYFIEKKYHVITTFSQHRLNVGILPDGIEEKIVNYNSIQEMIIKKEESLKHDDLFLFLDLPDYHKAVDDFSGLDVASKKGIKVLSNTLNNLTESLDLEQFDHIYFFSDHGCTLQSDVFNSNDLEFLGDNRSKIVMFHHVKGEYDLVKSNKLVSIMDVFPSLIELTNENNKRLIDDHDGIPSLLEGSDLSHNIIFLEDHASHGQPECAAPELWGLRMPEYFIFLNSSERKTYKINEDSELYIIDDEGIFTKWSSQLERISNFYTAQIKMKKIQKFYKSLKEDNEDYSDGTARLGPLYIMLCNRYWRFLKLIEKVSKKLSTQRI